MEIKDVKNNLKEIVTYRDKKNNVESDYRFTGCILRKDEDGQFFYQAELQDLKANCILCVSLESIEVKV